jgi:hypothetical protein
VPLPLPPSASDDPSRLQSLSPGTAAFIELLSHLVGHVPGGSYLLVDALVRFFASVHTWPSSHGNADSSSSGVTPAAADLRTARGWARAWVLVMQWVSTSAPRGDARGALSRLAEVATQLLCWPPPDHASSSGPSDGPESSGSSSDGVDSAAHSGGGGGSYTVGDSSQLASPLRVSTPHIGGGAAFDRFEAAGASDDAADESVSVVAAEAAAGGANLDYVCQHQAFLAGRDYLSQVLIGSVCPRRLVVCTTSCLVFMFYCCGAQQLARMSLTYLVNFAHAHRMPSMLSGLDLLLPCCAACFRVTHRQAQTRAALALEST